MSEQAIVTAKANVMVYDDQAKKWNPSGSSPGMSKVQIFQHLLNQSYRVVGRKLQDHEVVINCLLAKGLKYNQANQTFLQWRDSKQVYGLHFQSKEEADVFAQTLKIAVDNLNRLAAVTAVNNTNTNTANGSNGSGSNGDNISLGKRSTTSSDYNQSIYDENDRPYNMNPNNAMMNHHPNSSSNLYASQAVGQLAQMRQQQLQQQQQQHQQQLQAPNLVTATALSTSTSSCSSTSSTGSGLTISINNQNGHNSSSNLNGHNYPNHRQTTADYNFNTNGAPALTNLNPYMHQQQQANMHHQQPVAAPPPMYQSSPIQQPPPPPPIPTQLFANNNNNNIDQYSAQKIYDVIPDTGNYPSSAPSTVVPVAQPPVPPPLPVGLFSGLNNGPSSAGPVPPPPPPPPPPSLNGHGTNGSSSNSLMNEIARAQGGKTLKKVEDNSRDTIRAAPMDFLAEIKQKFEKKNQQQQQQQNGNENHSPTESSSSHNGLGQQRKSSVQLNKPNGQNGHFESPKAIKKITSTPNVVNNCTNNSSNGSSSNSYTNGVHTSDPYSTSINMEKLKQELVIEFRKELQSFKSDIINAILNELRR